VDTWAIVPVKPLHRGKSRLAGALSETDRYSLNIALLVRTLEVLKRVETIHQTAVVSRDPAVFAIAADCGVEVIHEQGENDLNKAVQHAADVLRDCSADGMLVLPADLPLIQPHDIESFIRMGEEPPVIVISPDRHESGTNALYMKPIGVIEFAFGPGSYYQHCRLVETAGARLIISQQSALRLDLDMPEDLEILRQMEYSLPGVKLPSIITY